MADTSTKENSLEETPKATATVAATAVPGVSEEVGAAQKGKDGDSTNNIIDQNATSVAATATATVAANDDSDEEDEDYVPPPDDDDDNGNGASTDPSLMKDGNVAGATTMLSFTKQQAVDSAFNDLFGDTSSVGVPPSCMMEIEMDGDDSGDAIGTGTGTTASKKKTMKGKKKRKSIVASKKAMKKKKQILSDIFGSTAAMKLISRSSLASSSSSSSSSTMKRRAVPLSSQRKKQIIEKKVFAGQTIEIKRTVIDEERPKTLPSGLKPEPSSTTTTEEISSNSNANTPGQQQPEIIQKEEQQQQQNVNINVFPKKPKSNIDQVLSRISNANSKISTIDKTNIDWENYKEDHLNDTLKDQLQTKVKSNDAYLEKKDFLLRVDQRRFEQEKDERSRQRAAAASSQGSKMP